MSKSIDGKVQPGESSFDAECRRLGLDPNKTSLFGLECVKHGLDPKNTSPDALTRAGSTLYSQYQL